MQKLDILGVALSDYSLKEALLMTDAFVSSGALNTVLFITAPMLVLAGKNPEEKERIEQMDLAILGDSDILRVAKLDTKIRMYETENQIFLKEFLRRIKQNSSTIYLLSDSEGDIEKLEASLRIFQDEIQIAGSQIIGGEANVEEVANAINDVVPSVIISRMAIGRQENFMLEARPFINAEVWLGIPEDMVLGGTKETIQKKAVKTIYKKIFNRIYRQYRNENEEE